MMIPARNVRLKRAYEPASDADGERILVDRLWPRGIRKADLRIDNWMKDISPSNALRRWFNHEPDRWQDFQRRYQREISEHADLLGDLRRRARRGAITLVYAARNEQFNDAVVLRKVILGRPAPRRSAHGQ